MLLDGDPGSRQDRDGHTVIVTDLDTTRCGALGRGGVCDITGPIRRPGTLIDPGLTRIEHIVLVGIAADPVQSGEHRIAHHDVRERHGARDTQLIGDFVTEVDAVFDEGVLLDGDRWVGTLWRTSRPGDTAFLEALAGFHRRIHRSRGDPSCKRDRISPARVL